MKIIHAPLLLFTLLSCAAADNFSPALPDELVTFAPNRSLIGKKLALSGTYRVVCTNKNRYWVLRPNSNPPKTLYIFMDTYGRRPTPAKRSTVEFNLKDPVIVKKVTYSYGCVIPEDHQPRRIEVWVEYASRSLPISSNSQDLTPSRLPPTRLNQPRPINDLN